MGVEWELGCERCLRFLWLGSQKPLKWRGFQVGDAVVRRFMGLHDRQGGCTLKLTNDGCASAPWEDGAHSGWREDVLSRTFWDSWSAEGLDCAHCGATGPRSVAPGTSPERGPGLRKNAALWFCDEPCFAEYCDYQATQRDRQIYDSTDDVVPFGPESVLAVACLDCRAYLRVDGADDGGGTLRDMEALAHFLCEHIGDHRLAALHIAPGEEDRSGPWLGDDADRWRAYVT
jgi:hypothetical protein